MIGVPVLKVKVRCHISLSKCPDMETGQEQLKDNQPRSKWTAMVSSVDSHRLDIADVKRAYNPVD
jgi:hypothetical protein